MNKIHAEHHENGYIAFKITTGEGAVKSSLRAAKSQKTKRTFIDWVNEYGTMRLARDLGIDRSTISHWRNGTLPKTEHMRKIVGLSKGRITYVHIIDGGQ